MSTCQLFVELISILVRVNMCFCFVLFCFVFFVFFFWKHNTIMNWQRWNIREAKQAPKSMTGTLHWSLGILRWSVKTLLPRNLQRYNSYFYLVNFFDVRLLLTNFVVFLSFTGVCPNMWIFLKKFSKMNFPNHQNYHDYIFQSENDECNW